MGLKVLHAGQDISLYVVEKNEGSLSGTGGSSSDDLQIISVLGQGAGAGAGGSGRGTTAQFAAWLGPAAKAKGKTATPSGTDIIRQGEVQVYDATGTAIFGGYLTNIADATESIDVKTHFNCADYWQSLDRIEVQEMYTGYGDVYIIKDLLTKYAPWIDQSKLPATDNYTFDRRPCKGTLRECIQKLADVTGWQVWVDPTRVIHYVSPASASTAPFALSDDPDSITSFGYNLTKYEMDDNAIINRVYFYGGKNRSPDFTQDLSIQANGSNKTFVFAYQPEDATDGKKHIVLNGTELSVGSVYDTSAAGKLKSQGGTSDVLINANSGVATFDVAPATGCTLTARYRYSTPLVIVLSNQDSYNFYGEWFDGRITDSTVFDVNSALQRCRVLLAQQAFGLVHVSLTTWTGGLQAGQLVRVTNGIRGIDDTYLVQQVTTKPLGGGQFEYDVELGAWNWNLLDILIQGARILNPTDGYTEEDMTIIQAKETAVAGTVTIVINKTTHTTGQYYAGQAPTYSGFFTVSS